MPRERPRASWFPQMEFYLKDISVAGRTMAKRKPKQYRRKVDAATRYFSVLPIPELTSLHDHCYRSQLPDCRCLVSAAPGADSRHELKVELGCIRCISAATIRQNPSTAQ